MVLKGHKHWPTLPFRMLHGPERAYTVAYIHTWRLYIKGLLLYAMLKYLWTGIICTPHFLKSLQKRLAFIDMNRDHSQSGISEWKKKKKFTFWCHHVWTMCEHYCVNIHLWIASLNALYPVCACTMQVYLNIHVIYCHLHITMCHHVWTMCEHYCVNIHLWIASLNALYPVCACTMQVYLHLHVLHCQLHITMCHHVWTMCEHYSVNIHLWIVSLNALYPVCPCTMQFYLHLHVIYCHLHITMCHHVWIVWIVSLNALYPVCACTMQVLSTSSCTTLPLAYYHVSPYVNMVWTLLCEHACVNCFFKCTVPCMCMHNASFIYIFMYYTATCILQCVTLCEHGVNTTVWTCMCKLFL